MAQYGIHEPFSRGPGPPWAGHRPPPGPFEDGDDEYLAGGPDDLGDLILDMRDGGAWAEGLMDCGESSQPAAGDAMQMLQALSRAQQAQDLEQQAQAAPAVRAALAHPGQPPRGTLMHPAMVPVGGGGPLTCAAGLACGTESQWPPAPQPAGPLPFFGAPTSAAPGGGAPPLPWFVSLPSMGAPAPPPINFYPPDIGGPPNAAQRAAMQQQGVEGQLASGSGSVGFSDGTTLRVRSSLDSGCGSTLPAVPGRPHRAAAVPLYGMPLGGEFEESRDAPSDSSDVEDGGDRMDRQHSLAQVVPDAGMFVPGAALPLFCGYYGSQAALTARLARHASLERFRLKKARRALAGGGRKIRYVARKVNADKRIRVKGRFVKADEAAAILAAEAHEAQVSTEQVSTEHVSISMEAATE